MDHFPPPPRSFLKLTGTSQHQIRWWGVISQRNCQLSDSPKFMIGNPFNPNYDYSFRMFVTNLHTCPRKRQLPNNLDTCTQSVQFGLLFIYVHEWLDYNHDFNLFQNSKMQLCTIWLCMYHVCIKSRKTYKCMHCMYMCQT